MVPTARLIFATNALPQINDRTDGVWRRLIAMPLFRQFDEDERDRQRADRLREELPGIFDWAVAGAQRLYQQGGFTDCAVCRRCADEHRHHSDPFRQWIEERVIMDQELAVPTHAAYKNYCEFCEANGRKPTNSSDLGKRVLAIPGIQKRKLGPRGSRKWHYTGLGLSSGSETITLDRIWNGRRRRRSIYYS